MRSWAWQDQGCWLVLGNVLACVPGDICACHRPWVHVLVPLRAVDDQAVMNQQQYVPAPLSSSRTSSSHNLPGRPETRILSQGRDQQQHYSAAVSCARALKCPLPQC